MKTEKELIEEIEKIKDCKKKFQENKTYALYGLLTAKLKTLQKAKQKFLELIDEKKFLNPNWSNKEVIFVHEIKEEIKEI